MTAPNVPPNFVPTNNESIDLKTGIVTEAGTGIQMSEDQYAQAMVNAHEAHDVNEARVKMGLPQLTTLPASPDGAGNPTFTVGAAPASAQSGYSQTAGEQSAVQGVAPVILPIPHASAPVAAHVSFWGSFWSYFSHAAVVTGHSLTNPAVLAAAAPFVPPKYQGIVGAIGVIEQVAEAPSTPAH